MSPRGPHCWSYSHNFTLFLTLQADCVLGRVLKPYGLRRQDYRRVLQLHLLISSLTLGAHAQRGLLYLFGGLCVCVCLSVCVCVCVSVCLCVCLHLFSLYRDQAGSSAIPTALAQQGLEMLCGDFA